MIKENIDAKDPVKDPRPTEDAQARTGRARTRRQQALELSFNQAQRPKVLTDSNGDNANYPGLPMAFTKGLGHGSFGEVSRADYARFADALTAIDPIKGQPDTEFKVPGAKEASVTVRCKHRNGDSFGFRSWESPLAGAYFSLEGPDPDGVAMAPAPKFGESELVFEMAEVYAMAITRDMSFDELGNGQQQLYFYDSNGTPQYYNNDDGSGSIATVEDLCAALNSLSWMKDRNPSSTLGGRATEDNLTVLESVRRSAKGYGRCGVSPKRLFRGSTPGVESKNYLSQFLLLGNSDPNNPGDGQIRFGAQRIDQRINPVAPGVDYMTSWAEWLDVQNGVDLRGRDLSTEVATLINTPRHLAQFVHIDELYQAYFNACLLMLSAKDINFSNGFPNNQSTRPMRTAFASFGGPHILSLMTEVASRALKCVRRQKFQVHRRARPERLAAMLTLAANGYENEMGADEYAAARLMLDDLGIGSKGRKASSSLMSWVQQYNAVQNSNAVRDRRDYACDFDATNLPDIEKNNFLLPMAFPEGSPMHPAYGAGHATVAGACVTVLKAFFQTRTEDGRPVSMGDIPGGDPELTLEGELNKLAANISIGRNFAGVHYYTDYFDSLRMGERIAVGVMHEQLLNYNEELWMNLQSFDDDSISFGTDGGDHSSAAYFAVDGDRSAGAMNRWWVRHLEEFDNNPSRSSAASLHASAASSSVLES